MFQHPIIHKVFTLFNTIKVKYIVTPVKTTVYEKIIFHVLFNSSCPTNWGHKGNVYMFRKSTSVSAVLYRMRSNFNELIGVEITNT